MYGLTYSSCLPMVRTLVRVYFAEPSKERRKFAKDIIKHFSLGRTPLIHFTGVWDTVESIGLTGGLKITNSKELEYKRFVHVRHAVSLHENRAKYKPRLYDEPDFTQEERDVRSFKQVWFRGVHSDVGGSYKEDGLSNVALNWMIHEAGKALEFSEEGAFEEKPDQPLHDQTLECPYWVLTGVNTRKRPRGAHLHSTAEPVGGATPAKRSKPWWHWPLAGLVVFAAAILFFASSVEGACTFREGTSWVTSALSPASWGALSQCWQIGIPRTASGAIGLALLWICLPYPLSWALRRWSSTGVVKGAELPFAAARVHYGLWGLLLFDGLVALLSWQASAAWSIWMVLALFTLKMACLAWILSFLAIGALRGPRATLPRPAQTAGA